MWAIFFTTAKADSNPPDLLTRRSANALVAEMAGLIKQYAYFNGGTATFRYDAWADTTNGLKLHIAEQVAVLGDRAQPDRYSIDFSKPVKSADLQLVMGRNNNFWIEASKNITQKTKNRRQKGIGIFFFTNEKKRTTDFGKLHDQLATVIR